MRYDTQSHTSLPIRSEHDSSYQEAAPQNTEWRNDSRTSSPPRIQFQTPIAEPRPEINYSKQRAQMEVDAAKLVQAGKMDAKSFFSRYRDAWGDYDSTATKHRVDGMVRSFQISKLDGELLKSMPTYKQINPEAFRPKGRVMMAMEDFHVPRAEPG